MAQALQAGMRVTLHMGAAPDNQTLDDGSEVLRAEVVSPDEPRRAGGLYWGYTTRIASGISAVFSECPYQVCSALCKLRQACAADTGSIEDVAINGSLRRRDHLLPESFLDLHFLEVYCTYSYSYSRHLRSHPPLTVACWNGGFAFGRLQMSFDSTNCVAGRLRRQNWDLGTRQQGVRCRLACAPIPASACILRRAQGLGRCHAARFCCGEQRTQRPF